MNAPFDWERIKQLVAELLELSASERHQRLTALAQHDAALGDEVRSLLDAADTMGDRFEHGALADIPPAPLAEAGTRFGPWRVVREIGHGGMGTVFEVERDEPFRMAAALKLAGSSHLGTEGRRRFATEQQTLANLHHRNIAALLDGGVTADGTPWFVMEYVRGVAIDQYCNDARLSIRSRLELFRQVCAAVHYAHQHMVVHRDLKPGNILVDEQGTVKLLDFGIAKLLASGGDDVTRADALPLTPAYAAPEQLRGEPVSTVSDVFALGVVLYELLTGCHPVSRDVMERLATPRPVTAPSRNLSPEHPARVAASAHTARRALSGDVDAIVLTALRDEQERRYPSAQALGDDLRRALAGQAVAAQPDTFSYLASRFIRRNRVAVFLGTVALLAVITGAVVAARLAARASVERDRAVLEASRTRQVTQFFQDVFGDASPARLGSDVTVVAAIDHAIPRIDTTFADNPDLRAAIKTTLAATLLDMYQPERARPLAEDALRTFDSLGSRVGPRDRADALYNLGSAEAATGTLGRAESLYVEALRVYGTIPGIDSAEIWRGVGQLANVVGAAGRLDESLARHRETVAALARLTPTDSVSRSIALTNLATLLAEMGRYDEAEPEFREAIALLGRGEGARRHRLAALLQPWAGTLHFLGRTAEAETAARRSVTMNRELFGDRAAPTIIAERMLVTILAEDRRCDAAIAAATALLAHAGALPPSDPSVGTALMYRGWCRATGGDGVGGERDARQALALRRQQFPEGHWAIAQAESVLGDVLARRGAGARVEAGALLRSGYDGLSAQLDSSNARVQQARQWLEAYQGHPVELPATGRPDDASAAPPPRRP